RLKHAGVELVGDAVAVRVCGVGAAVLVLEAVVVLGLVRAAIDGVHDPVTVAISRFGRGAPAIPRQASARRRQSVGRFGVELGELEVGRCLGGKPLIELELGEAQLRLSEGQLTRSAGHGAVPLGLCRELTKPGDLAAQRRALAATCEEEGRRGEPKRGRERVHGVSPRRAARLSAMARLAYCSLSSASWMASP